MYVNCRNIGRVKKWLCIKLVSEAQKLSVLEDCVLCHINFIFEVSTLQEFDQAWIVCGS
jgi:hypothetical protein